MGDRIKARMISFATLMMGLPFQKLSARYLSNEHLMDGVDPNNPDTREMKFETGEFFHLVAIV